MSAQIEQSDDSIGGTEHRRIAVFVVDDHTLVREGLTSILAREPDLEVVGGVESAELALELIPIVDPDVIVVDQVLPGMNGIELCREIAERRFRGQVVVLSAFIEEDVFQAAMQAGARAYVVKEIEADELKRAIRSAARGETVIDPKVAGRVVRWAARLDPRGVDSFKPVELDILRLLVVGKSNSQIAESAGLAVHTVKTYLARIYTKLDVKGRAEATAVALRRGLI